MNNFEKEADVFTTNDRLQAMEELIEDIASDLCSLRNLASKKHNDYAWEKSNECIVVCHLLLFLISEIRES